jgi:hypothetical protein
MSAAAGVRALIGQPNVLRASALALVFAWLGVLGGCAEGAPSRDPRRGSLPEGEVPLDALSRRHARLRERMENRGYQHLLPIARVFTVEGSGVVVPLDLEVGVCTTIVALASSGVRDLRLSIYDGQGEEAARDEVAGEGGLLHLCPEDVAGGAASLPYYLAVEARDGAGSVALAQFRSLRGEGEGFEGLFDGVLAPRVPFHDVEERLAKTRTALRARGFSPVEPSRVSWVGGGGVLRIPVRFETGRCYVATARGGTGVRDVDLFLFDPAGVEIGRDLGTDAEPMIEHCPESAGRFMVEARAFEGEGAIGVMVLAAPESFARTQEVADVGVLEAELPTVRADPVAADVALGVVVAELGPRGFQPPVFVTRDAPIAPGEARMHEVVVGPGCALIVASASHAGMDVDLYLVDASSREIDADTAVHSTARVRACRPAPTVLRVAVKAYGRDGRYALALLRAPAGITDVQGLRLEEATATPRARGYEEVARWSVRLERGETFGREVRVESHRCLTIAAAGAAGIRDVDLFLRGDDGALVASDSGPGAFATVTRCASAGGATLRLEATANAEGEIVFAALEGGFRGEPAAGGP